MKLEAYDHESLKDAVNILENLGLAIQITNFIGKPIEYGVRKLPDSISERIGEATRCALRFSLRVAVSTMNNQRGLRPSNPTHKIFATLSGAAGGAFGLPALAIELPVFMLRSIADAVAAKAKTFVSSRLNLPASKCSPLAVVRSLMTDQRSDIMQRVLRLVVLFLKPQNTSPKRVSSKKVPRQLFGSSPTLPPDSAYRFLRNSLHSPYLRSVRLEGRRSI